MARSKSLPTIWEVSDGLWERVEWLLREYDPPKTTGRSRTNTRGILNGIIFRPVGPYRFAGWSLGGVLAYEVAIQLIGQDQIVEFAGLILKGRLKSLLQFALSSFTYGKY
jgi:hypothetical protein